MDEYKYSGDYDDPLLAELYDQAETYQEDVFLLRKLIGKAGSLRILECFSGTGRMLLPLAQDGHTVTGIEIASAMHARAKRKLDQLGKAVRTRVELKVKDVLDGDWGDEYDLVILGANAFYELPSATAQEQCIGFAADALKPHGLLFVDNNDYKGDWGKGPFGMDRVIFEGTGDDGSFGRFVMKSSSYDETEGVLYLERTWTKRDPDGRETRQRYLGRKHPVSAQEVKAWLIAHGFDILALLGSRHGDPYTPKSDRAIFWARRNDDS